MEKIAISFSGGRSSALMTKLVLDKYKSSEIEITFANTGFEHPDTLRFVNDCDRYLFNNRVVWIEAIVNQEEGKGVDFRVVNYKTASRHGEPYIDGVKKYGLWNQANPACTSRLKITPMEKYLKTKGFIRGKNLNYWTAIGIRGDEIDRISQNYKREKIFYPLVDAKINKREVLKWCKQLPFDLKIDEHYGNCVGCFKKSTRKLATIAIENPQMFDQWREIEEKFKNHKATKASSDPTTGLRRIYREHKTVNDLIQIGNEPGFRPFSSKEKDGQGYLFDEFDLEFGCGESCEIY